MNTIDALEEAVKYILDAHFNIYIKHHLDDSEYVLYTRAVLKALEAYLKDHREALGESGEVVGNLYNYAKNLWMENLRKIKMAESESAKGEEESMEDEDYYHYYYDILYQNDIFPR